MQNALVEATNKAYNIDLVLPRLALPQKYKSSVLRKLNRNCQKTVQSLRSVTTSISPESRISQSLIVLPIGNLIIKDCIASQSTRVEFYQHVRQDVKKF